MRGKESIPTMNWQDNHLRLAEFIETASANPTGATAARKLMALLIRDLLDQADFLTWAELKTAMTKANTINGLADSMREWQQHRTENTAGVWAYEIIAINLEGASSNDPIATVCEQLTDGLITKALEDFPE